MHMGVLPICNSVHHLHAWCLQRPEESIRFTRCGVIDACELTCRCWESNLSQEEHPVILTTEPSLQFQTVFLLMRWVLCIFYMLNSYQIYDSQIISPPPYAAFSLLVVSSGKDSLVSFVVFSVSTFWTSGLVLKQILIPTSFHPQQLLFIYKMQVVSQKLNHGLERWGSS